MYTCMYVIKVLDMDFINPRTVSDGHMERSLRAVDSCFNIQTK